jgi:hypothetical protein
VLFTPVIFRDVIDNETPSSEKDESNNSSNTSNIDRPFSDWSKLIHKAVYSIDGKKIGYLSKITSEYMIVTSGILRLSKYYIPMTLAESVSKKGIRIHINIYEASSKYSHRKMKNTLTGLGILPKHAVEQREFFDRYQTFRYHVTRNRLAASIAFVSGVLLLLSGYKANLAIYHLIRNEVIVYTTKELSTLILTPIGLLALLSQLGGISVLIGAALFATNRVNLGKFWVMIGTGQGLVTVALHIILELLSFSPWSDKSFMITNNYIFWLTSTGAGLGVMFSILAQSVSKGKKEGIIPRIFRIVRKKLR